MQKVAFCIFLNTAFSEQTQQSVFRHKAANNTPENSIYTKIEPLHQTTKLSEIRNFVV